MTEAEFREIVGKCILVDYPFMGETQKWDMRNFYIDGNGNISHIRLPLIIETFIANARNPHTPADGEEATHG